MIAVVAYSSMVSLLGCEQILSQIVTSFGRHRIHPSQASFVRSGSTALHPKSPRMQSTEQFHGYSDHHPQGPVSLLGAATHLSLLFIVVLASKDGLPDLPSEAASLCDLLSCFFEIVHNRPADCGVLLRFCGLTLVLRELVRVLAYEFWIELFAVGFFFNELRLEGAEHWFTLLARGCGL